MIRVLALGIAIGLSIGSYSIQAEATISNIVCQGHGYAVHLQYFVGKFLGTERMEMKSIFNTQGLVPTETTTWTGNYTCLNVQINQNNDELSFNCARKLVEKRWPRDKDTSQYRLRGSLKADFDSSKHMLKLNGSNLKLVFFEYKAGYPAESQLESSMTCRLLL